MEAVDKEIELGDKKSYAGIPEAEFVEDVDAYMARPENVDGVDEVLKRLDNQHAKYKFMEYNLASKKKRLQTQVPELKRSLLTIEELEKQKTEFEAQFLLSEQVFAKAKIPPTEHVCLWLGANVMLEYTLEDAKKLLSQNIAVATRNLGYVEHDLDFLRDQFTTTEVNMARVYNWDVKRKQAAKAK
ncbi:prefoldin subunit 3 [Coccinella septempunctata]|uniref:prefoldin subunit 3 n=1 Tax=Coccinella septempunctata TaxID=41139 RepID=UPI001D0635F2|nr:prefoldin subunit 3 [Coccinella septempunctata]